MLKSIFQINSKLIFTAIFCLITSVSYAADSTVTKSQAPQVNQSSLPEWVYKELSSIQKEVSVLDATGASKESIHELKERLAKVEVQLEQSQLRVDDSLKVHGERIEDLHASSESSFSSISLWTTWLSVLIGLLGLLVAGSAALFSFNSKKEAIKQARKDANDWLKNNQNNLEKQFEQSKERLEAERIIEIAAMKEEINALVFESKVDIASVQSKVKDIGKDVTEKVLSRLKIDNYTITKEESIEVAGKVEKVLNKPDAKKSTNDWRMLAIEAYLANQYNEALTFIEKVFIQEKLKNELTAEELVSAMFLKGAVLGKLNRPKEAIDIYSDVMNLFSNSEHPAMKIWIATAMVNKGIMLYQLSRLKESIEKYSDVVKQFGKNQEPLVQKQVAIALINTAVALGDLNLLEEAITTNYDMVRRFRHNQEPSIQLYVAIALVNKGKLLVKLGRPIEAIDTYDYMLNIFYENTELVIQERVAMSMGDKAVTLGKLNRLEEAFIIFEDMKHKFNKTENLVILKVLEISLLNKAEFMLVQGNKLKAKKAIAEAIEFLDDECSINHFVMVFFNFILKASLFDSIFNSIDKLSDDLKFGWEFEMLRPIINKLSSPHKKQVKAIVRFFEEHKDKEQLKAELADISSN